jgi:hypothetical protein
MKRGECFPQREAVQRSTVGRRGSLLPSSNLHFFARNDRASKGAVEQRGENQRANARPLGRRNFVDAGARFVHFVVDLDVPPATGVISTNNC